MSEGNISFETLHGFNMSVHYVEGETVSPESSAEHHVHGECEIYFHLGGDVSFMVEDKIYPIQYGNVVITRPYEYHHCIYNRKTKHRHFCIMFSVENNESLLDIFFDRQKGRHNLFALDSEKTDELIELCHALCGDNVSGTEKYFYFFKMLRLFRYTESIGESAGMPKELASVLRCIHESYAERLSVRSLAENAHISVSTLERLFADKLGMTPSVYIKKIRLANAARMLSKQCSVTEAAEGSGFSDVSAMIALFKDQYGVTPLKYKKERQ